MPAWLLVLLGFFGKAAIDIVVNVFAAPLGRKWDELISDKLPSWREKRSKRSKAEREIEVEFMRRSPLYRERKLARLIGAIMHVSFWLVLSGLAVVFAAVLLTMPDELLLSDMPSLIPIPIDLQLGVRVAIWIMMGLAYLSLYMLVVSARTYLRLSR